MIYKGQVYKFLGKWGIIRPDKFGQTRMDVLFDKNINQLVIGDRIEYEQIEKNNRRYAENIVKIG